MRGGGVVLRLAMRGALAVVLALMALGGLLIVPRATPAAFACGLGNSPTMLANNHPALLYPVGTNIPADQPIGTFALDYVAKQSITFGEDLSRVPDAPPADSLKWRWSFGDHSGYQYTVNPSHAYATAGSYSVHAQIIDTSTGGWTDLDSAQIHIIASVPQNPPTAVAAASATSIALDSDVTFDAAGSRASDGSALTYFWNFNDGDTATGARVSRKFGAPGRGFVALIVTDQHGAKSVATIDVIIVPELPKAILTASDSQPAVGVEVTFDASKSQPPSNPPGDVIVGYGWNFGDGSPDVNGANATTAHTYQSPGVYTVTLHALEQSGAAGVATMKVSVKAARAATGSAGGTGPDWLLLGIGLLALVGGVVAVVLFWREERRRNALIRQRRLAQELARSRRVNGPGRSSQAGARPRVQSRALSDSQDARHIVDSTPPN